MVTRRNRWSEQHSLRTLPGGAKSPFWQVPSMTLPRRWLVAACVAAAVVALATAGWRQWSAASGARLARVQYESVRLGMTEAEVTEILGPLSQTGEVFARMWNFPTWEMAASEPPGLPPVVFDRRYLWWDETTFTEVAYRDRRVVAKAFAVGTPQWQLTARAWLDWLRGLVRL